MAYSSEVQRTLCALIKPYHVFISHRGPDTKDILASVIYHYFSRSGLNVFFDREEFDAGQVIPSTIPEAISSSSVHIAILSPKYAESHWCLEELRLMHHSGATIFPVFYGVRPGVLLQLRNNTGIYADAFRELEEKMDGKKKRHESDTIEEWKEALYKVSNISGFLDSDHFKGDLGKLVDTLYSKVMQHVRKVWKKSVDGLHGLENAIDELDNCLEINREQSEKVKIVGIVGIPGCGKTTLAEEFYYRHRSSFDRSSLLLGVREASNRNGLPTLQSQLLRDLANDCLAISNVSEGKDILADRVRRLCRTKSLKFLIVIDDIDYHHQLEALLREEDVLGSGSLVIVTSRSKGVLKLSGISLFYETKPLRWYDAQKLLCRSAFHESQQINGFENLIQTALSKCGCFPKFLKSLGENLQLYGNNEQQDWEDELKTLIPEIFKAICGCLEEEEKQIFLDIACFFRKMDKNSAIRVWAGSGWRGARALQKLQYMSLVHVDAVTNRISIPDYLRDLGREIADRQLHNSPDLPYRLWCPNAARSFLKEPLLQAAAKIRGTREASHKNLSRRTTEELFKIELLDVRGDIHYATFSDRLKNLLWLRWKNCAETPILPPGMHNLRVLELIKGNLQTLDLSFKHPVELREISVIECTRRKQISPTIGLLNHLDKMTLHGTVSLESLPPEFCKLQALKHLVLRQSECLKTLPANFGDLTNLEHIEFSYCQQLSSLPQSFRNLTRLKTLDLRDCWSLIIQADIFDRIRSIEELTMENCKELKMLPTQTTLQGSLRKLNLFGTSLKNCQLISID
ncbi:disease resistance protein RUN1-like [Cryptomeria japonica]|uniref:disease resistance protein RUN1-like n=1 Tax=Cryptomeria japonica TaxID=3369 RepID=UPI0027D9EE47|nr:disease resistance protein RUN1-like [Cryptomeria japonica]